MSHASAIKTHLLRRLAASDARTSPHAHWLLNDALPRDTAAAIRDLPLAVPEIADTEGKRETHNALRAFFSTENQSRFAVCRDVAETLQAPDTIAALECLTGVQLAGSYLRIEHCQDTDGFWLEPHTDIGAKLFTLLIYLSEGPGCETWGTDIYDAERNHLGATPYGFNKGLIFVPGENTWHGFERRPIGAVRKSIIVNYVKDEWRARQELAYPDRPVAT